MARNAASAVWTVLGVVAAALLVVAVVFGPRLYREGRAMVGPITDMARAEKELAALDAQLPWQEPADGRIAADRLTVFLAVRRDLAPHYQRWEEKRREVEGRPEPEGWQAAKEILAAAGQVLAAQTATLRQHGMSRAEFRWLELEVYDGWPHARAAAVSADADRRLRSLTEDDLRFVAGLAAEHGPSPALAAVGRRLEQRLAALPPETAAPATDDPDQALLAARGEEIAALDFSAYQDLHARLRQAPGEEFTVRIGEGGDRPRAEPERDGAAAEETVMEVLGEPEATPAP